MASLIQFYNPVIDQWLSGAGLIPCKIVKRSSSQNIWETFLCQQNYFLSASLSMLLSDSNAWWRRNAEMDSTNICHCSKMRNISKWIDASDFRMEMNQKKISPDCRWLLCWWSLNNKIWWDRYRVSYDYNVGHIWIQWGHLTEHQDVRGNLIISGSTLIGIFTFNRKQTPPNGSQRKCKAWPKLKGKDEETTLCMQLLSDICRSCFLPLNIPVWTGRGDVTICVWVIIAGTDPALVLAALLTT